MPFCPNCGAGTSGAACEVCGHKAELPQTAALPTDPQLPPLRIRAVLASSIRDAYGEMRKHARPMLVMAAIATVLGLLLFSVATDDSSRLSALNDATNIFLAVIGYYALAASVRTIFPEFRFDVATFFVTIGWSLLASLCIMAAAIALIIPALWVGPKLSLAPYVYLLSRGTATENPMVRSWRMTTGHYWATLGLGLIVGTFICLVIVVEVAVAAILTRAGGLAGALVAIPLLCIGFAWVYQVFYLCLIRWTYLLMERDSGPITALQPAS